MEHEFQLKLTWIGNTGTGTSGARDFSRNHEIVADGLPVLPGSAAAEFRGDSSRYNPEQLLLAAVAQCHMMTYFFLAVQHRIAVLSYQDAPSAWLTVHPNGSGEITRVRLRPNILLAAGTDLELALELHNEVKQYCFIARSVNFDIEHQVELQIAE